MKKEKKHISYSLVVNNPSTTDVIQVSTFDDLHFICGREKGKNGVPHLQIAMVLKKPMTFSEMKSKVPRAHIEVVNRGYWNAYNYCKKEEDYYEHGDLQKALYNEYNYVKTREKFLYNKNKELLDLTFDQVSLIVGGKGGVSVTTSTLTPSLSSSSQIEGENIEMLDCSNFPQGAVSVPLSKVLHDVGVMHVQKDEI